MIKTGSCDGVSTVVIENDHLRAEVVPDIGGRVISLRHQASGREFLWRNPRLALKRCAPGSDYDPNFYGGMDELLPTDMPESIGGIACPDHGELWTLPLAAEIEADTLTVSGRLPLCGLNYERRMRLEDNLLICDYRIANAVGTERLFMWKLHAALVIHPGDRIFCPAATACVGDPAWSRRKLTTPFAWPDAHGLDMSRIPAPDSSTEFLCLYNLSEGRMAIEAVDGARIDCRFDRCVFPCGWYFASYGGTDDAFVAVIGPGSNGRYSVNAAARDGLCARLGAGQQIVTTVEWSVEGSA